MKIGLVDRDNFLGFFIVSEFGNERPTKSYLFLVLNSRTTRVNVSLRVEKRKMQTKLLNDVKSKINLHLSELQALGEDNLV